MPGSSCASTASLPDTHGGAGVWDGGRSLRALQRLCLPAGDGLGSPVFARQSPRPCGAVCGDGAFGDISEVMGGVLTPQGWSSEEKRDASASLHEEGWWWRTRRGAACFRESRTHPTPSDRPPARDAGPQDCEKISACGFSPGLWLPERVNTPAFFQKLPLLAGRALGQLRGSP